MPYIRSQDRSLLDDKINALIDIVFKQYGMEPKDDTAVLMNSADGAVNYILTRLLDSLYSNKDYAHYNRAMGILSCITQEYYRRAVVGYEEDERKINCESYVIGKIYVN